MDDDMTLFEVMEEPPGTVILFEDDSKVGLTVRTGREEGGWFVCFFRRDQLLDSGGVDADISYSIPGSTPSALLQLREFRMSSTLTVRRLSDASGGRWGVAEFHPSVESAMAGCGVGDVVLIAPEGRQPTGAVHRLEDGWVSTFHRARYMTDWEVDGLLDWYDVTYLHQPG